MNIYSGVTRNPVAALSRVLSTVPSDRVMLALLGGLALVALLDPDQWAPSLHFLARAFAGILPFLLLAVMLAALANATGADGLIAGAFSGHPARAVALAALAGALSPFCSCGVVPVIAALLRARVPLAPVMAFWIASPIMDPEMFVLTAAGISVEFALAKTAAAIAMGLLAGLAVYLFRDCPAFEAPLQLAGDGRSCSAALPGRGRVEWRFWRYPDRRRKFAREFTTTLAFLGKWLLLAFLLESLLAAYVPPQLVAGLLGAGAWYEVPLAALIGAPAYLNGYAAIPLVAELMDKGMNPGAALAFMTAGAVSSIPAAMAVAVLVKRPVFAAYVLLGITGAVATGVLYSLAG